MANCEKLEKCPFFNDKMVNMPTIAERLKERFCRCDKESCARYTVSQAGKPVPPDLFPNMMDRAKQIIAEH